MNLLQWLAFQQELHVEEIDLGLQRVHAVYRRLRLTWPDTIFITVGGTNGKGSTVAMLQAIYGCAGYRVGAFTSPHILKYSERIQINGCTVSDEEICAAFSRIEAVRKDISLTYFEFSTLAALLIFAEARVDVAILEVGLGGRLDAVNIIDTDCAIVTSIDIDHVAWLGDTREQIGFEKAGIFRAGKPAICGDLAIPASVSQHAKSVGALWFARRQHFDVVEVGDSWTLKYSGGQLTGLAQPLIATDVQFNNAACAVLAVSLLQTVRPVAIEHINSGLRQVALLGRTQVVPLSPEVVLDVAHNPAAMQVLVSFLQRQYHDQQIHLVLGVLADKAVDEILAQLAVLQPHYYLSRPDNPRALSAAALKERVQKLENKLWQSFPSVMDAYQAAVEQARQRGGVVVVTGSFACVAELAQIVPK